MYAIRSYYAPRTDCVQQEAHPDARLGPCGEGMDETLADGVDVEDEELGVDVVPRLFDQSEDVITSYSIHYTKLYEKAPRLVRKAAEKRAIRKFESPLFSPDFLARGKNAEGEAAALSIGMTLEKRAIEQFTALRRKVTGDAAAEKVVDDLIAWERDHLKILTRQYEQFREMYWEEARFWPF